MHAASAASHSAASSSSPGCSDEAGRVANPSSCRVARRSGPPYSARAVPRRVRRQVAAHPSRDEQRHPDAVRRQLTPQHLREPGRGVLGGGVEAVPEDPHRDQPRQRRRVHDVALGPLGLHARNERPAPVHHPKDVHLEDPAPVVLRRTLERPGVTDARDLDGLDAAEFAVGGVAQCVDLLLVPDVRAHSQRSRPNLPDTRPQPPVHSARGRRRSQRSSPRHPALAQSRGRCRSPRPSPRRSSPAAFPSSPLLGRCSPAVPCRCAHRTELERQVEGTARRIRVPREVAVEHAHDGVTRQVLQLAGRRQDYGVVFPWRPG